MKKLIALIFVLLMLPTPAHAASVITITEPSHRELNGTFIDDKLADLIAPDGRLGKLVSSIPSGIRIWDIDAALIDDVELMSKGYKLSDGKSGVGADVANQWLQKLKSATKYDAVEALPYGNPSGYWIQKLTPHSQSYFLQVGATHLSKFFGYKVNPVLNYQSFDYFPLTNYQLQAFGNANTAIQATSKYMKPEDSENFHLRIASMFNRDLNSNDRNTLAWDLNKNSYALMHTIRLAPGKFTISTKHQDLPLTVINDFPSPAKLKLQITELNGRIQAPNSINVSIDGKSRVQVKVPIDVIGSGDSSFDVAIYNDQNVQLGDDVIYPLSLKVINPIATWVTWSAALILFISAVIQSIRRMRRPKR